MTSLKEISVENVTVWSFYKVLETGDYNYLKKGALEDDWMRLYDEYFKRSGIKMPDWKIIQKYHKLILKHAVVSQLLDIVKKRDENEEAASNALLKWGYKFNGSQSFEWNTNRFEKSLEVLWTKVQIIESELPKEKTEVNLYRDVVFLKKHFKFDIDPKKTTCIEWIELNKQLKEDVGSYRPTG
ncbi:MAG: hypothetical protein AAFY00_03505 [Bacteroidota bacterium]